MRFYEYRQSETSPLKYHLELSAQEVEAVKEQLITIAQIIIDSRESVKEEPEEDKVWIGIHGDIVEWMTEPQKFPPRSDFG